MVGDALPGSGRAAVSGSMRLRRSPVLPPFVVHVKPVRGPQPDYGARHVAALVLVVEPGRQHRLDPERVATTLERTPAEAQEHEPVTSPPVPAPSAAPRPPVTSRCALGAPPPDPRKEVKT